MSTTTPIKVVILGDGSSAQKALRETGDDVEGFAGKTTGHLSKVTALLGGAFAAFGAVSFIKGGLDSLTNMDRIMQQTAAVVKSTGGAAKISADDVANFANAMERATGIEAENIQTGQNMLLTFTNIKNGVGAGNDIFNQASKTMVDLATAMGGDTQGAAIQLGKALNDPMKGITALTKVGVTFDDGQKAQIKTMQEHGNIAGAQKVILAELNKEFGGSAEAFGKSGAGQIAKFKNELGNLQDQLASALLPVLSAVTGYFAENLPKAVDFVAATFEKVGPFVNNVIGGFRAFFASFAAGGNDITSSGFAGYMEGLGNTMRSLYDRFTADVLPALLRVKDVIVGDVVPAIMSLVGWIRDHINPIMVVMGLVMAALIPHYVALATAAVASSIRQVISWVATNAAAVAGAFTHSAAVLGIVAGWVVMGVQAMLSAARMAAAWLIALGPIGLVIAAIVGVAAIVIANWDTIKNWTAAVWEWIVNAVKAAADFLVNLFLNWTGPGLIISHWQQIKNAAGAAWDWIVGKVSGVIEWFQSVPGNLSKAASGMWDGITTAFKAAINFIIRGWNGLDFKIPGFDIGPVHYGGFSLGLPDIPQLAQGAIVKARPGGTLVNIAEAGRDEAVVPLPRGFTPDSGGSNRPVVVHLTSHVEFHAPVYGVDDLDKKLDERDEKLIRELEAAF